jgi:hypothetical protein
MSEFKQRVVEIGRPEGDFSASKARSKESFGWAKELVNNLEETVLLPTFTSNSIRYFIGWLEGPCTGPNKLEGVNTGRRIEARINSLFFE